MVQRLFSKKIELKIVKDYLQGKGSPDIAKKYGCYYITILNIVRRHGHSIRDFCSDETKEKIRLANRKLNIKQRKQVKNCYIKNKKIPTITQDLAKKFNIDSATILKIVREMGGKTRTRSELIKYRLATGWRPSSQKRTPAQIAKITKINRILGKRRIGKPHPLSLQARKRASHRMKYHNPMQNPEIAKKVSEKLRGYKWSKKRNLKIKKLWCDPKYRDNQRMRILQGLIKRPNKQEIFLKFIFKKYQLPYTFVGNGKKSFRIHKVIFDGKCPDFMNCDGQNKIIELFGDYWHNRPHLKYHQTEKGTKAHYSQFGYKTLVIWEKELKNEQKLIQKIRGFDEN